MKKYLPELTDKEIVSFFGSLKKQLNFERGSIEREGIVGVYIEVQRTTTISATCVVEAASVFIFVWRDVKLRDLKQVLGKVL